MTEWIKGPETAVTLAGGKVTGPMVISHLAGDRVMVTIPAHHNTSSEREPALVVRGREVIGSVHLQRTSCGFRPTNVHLSYRGSISAYGGIAPTFEAAILDAMMDEVDRTHTAEIARQAERASLTQDLIHAERVNEQIQAKAREAALAVYRLQSALIALEG